MKLFTKLGFALLVMLISSSVLWAQSSARDIGPKKQTYAIASEAMFDLQFDWPVGVGGGEAGIECDGNYIYTTKWNGADFYRYQLDGTYIESFTVTGAANVRDLAYNGTYFYGGAATSTVFEMDFDAQSLVSSFTAPTDCRAIGYNEDDDVFYANNWGSDITVFDPTGTFVDSWSVGPTGDSYYGFAYQGAGYCNEGPFLWGYAQVGATLNELVQMELPDGAETGVYFDVGTVITVGTGIAGGLAIDDNLFTGYWTILGTCQNVNIWGLELCPSGAQPTNDVGVMAILEPSSGVDLTATEPVTIAVKNYGTAAQSNFDVSFSLDAGTPVVETITATINSGETYNHTFGTTVDLSAYGTYNFEACTDLAGDENPGNDCKTKVVENSPPSLCVPVYTTGCTVGDGFTDFALEQIENYGSGCADLNGVGWSQYLGLGPALLEGGNTYDVIMSTGYANNFATIWIDFNDDLDLTPDEIVLNNYEMLAAGQLYTVPMDIPAGAAGGQHIMRARTNWNATCDDPCASYSYGEAEDYYVQVGPSVTGNLDGTVTAVGGTPIEGATVTLVGTSYTANTIANGTYEILGINIGDYTAECSASGYITETAPVTIEDGITTTQDFELEEAVALDPPINVAAEVILPDDVLVTWEAPSPPVGEWIRWDNGINNGTGIGLTSGGTFYTASRWIPADLAPYDGQTLSKVSFYANGDPAATYEIMVWTGPDAGTLVSSEPVTSFTVDDFNEITLSTPVTIDASQELWFGYEVTHAAGTLPAGRDEGPAIPEKGDMISLDGTTWESMFNAYGFDYNWSLAGFVQSTDATYPAKPLVKQLPATISTGSFVTNAGTGITKIFNPSGSKALLGYNVYRNAGFLAYTTGLSLLDENLPNGTYEYCVSAVYDEGESIQVCAPEVTIGTALDPPTDLTATFVPDDDIFLDWVAPGGGPTGSILCVDRDGSTDLAFTDDWQFIQPALDALGVTYDYFEVTDLTQDGPDLATMEQYDMIIWFAGESWQNNQTMSDNDEANLTSYLGGGGNLFLSAHDYFWDRYPSAGNFSAGQFPYDYLGVASTTQDNWNIFSPDLADITGVTGSFAEGVTFQVADIYTTDKDGLYIDQIVSMDQDLFEVTIPTPAGIAACQFDGGTFKTAFTAVSLGAITDQSALEDVLEGAISWMTGGDSDALLGYNVYRDNNQINPSLVTATDYLDENLAPGTYEYCVTAVYDEGESACSNTASATVPGGACSIFSDDFESYNVGEQLVLQNSIDWTTWSNTPGSTEDPYIVEDGGNVVEITGVNDLVYVMENYTSGFYTITFDMLVPTGGDGYFNTLQEFAGANSQWGMQVYFGHTNLGEGNLDAGTALAQVFTFDYDTWMAIKVTVDIDNDWGEFFLDDVLIHGWIWSTGCFGTGTLNQLGGSNFFAWDGGVTGNPLYHFDNYCLDGEDECLPPQNPVATVFDEVNVHFIWDPPVSGVVLSYNVFRDGTYIANTTNTEYDDLNLDPGTYVYCVSAVYDGCESVQVCADPVSIFGGPPPPTNLEGVVGLNGIDLTWEGIGGAEWIQWDDGQNATSVGLTNGGTFSVASHWEPADLTPYDGYTLSKISFFPADEFATHILKVWTGPNGTTEVLSQDLASFNVGEWNEVELDNPVTINASDDFWFGYETTHLAGTFPAGADAGPALQGKGDMISISGGAWESLYVATGGVIDANWNLAGYVELSDGIVVPLIGHEVAPSFSGGSFASAPENGVATNQYSKFIPSSTKDLSYNVYHKPEGGSFSNIANTVNTFYTHTDPVIGWNYYYVTSLLDGEESVPSNEVSILFNSIEENIFYSTMIYPNPASDVVNIKSDFEINTIMVYNFAGQIVTNEQVNSKFYQINTSQYNAGIYFFRIETDEGAISKRIIIE